MGGSEVRRTLRDDDGHPISTIPMYGARKCASWEWAAVAYCERCDWFRHYPKCTVRRAMSYARHHYYAHHA